MTYACVDPPLSPPAPPPPMRIEAVTVCVDYGDFLAHTLPWNKALFDRWVVVTTETDRRTRDLCEHHHIECVLEDGFYSGDRAFAKAAGINAGLDRLGARDSLNRWVAHLDADIILPPRTRELLQRVELDPGALYGLDRLLCNSFEDWLSYVAWPEVMHSVNAFVQATHFPLATRVARLVEDGYIPIGFFQLWNPAGSGVFHYPDHGTAGRGDMMFARQWPRAQRHLIPELVAIHLASGEDDMGKNWRGRRSVPFGPTPAARR